MTQPRKRVNCTFLLLGAGEDMIRELRGIAAADWQGDLNWGTEYIDLNC